MPVPAVKKSLQEEAAELHAQAQQLQAQHEQDMRGKGHYQLARKAQRRARKARILRPPSKNPAKR